MLRFPPDYPDLLQTIASVLNDCLLQRGISETDAADAALTAANAVRDTYGGLELYITKGDWHQTERDLEIYNAFNGRNKAELAQTYSLTERRIEQICAHVRAKIKRERQAELAL